MYLAYTDDEFMLPKRPVLEITVDLLFLPNQNCYGSFKNQQLGLRKIIPVIIQLIKKKMEEFKCKRRKCFCNAFLLLR